MDGTRTTVGSCSTAVEGLEIGLNVRPNWLPMSTCAKLHTHPVQKIGQEHQSPMKDQLAQH